MNERNKQKKRSRNSSEPRNAEKTKKGKEDSSKEEQASKADNVDDEGMIENRPLQDQLRRRYCASRYDEDDLPKLSNSDDAMERIKNCKISDCEDHENANSERTNEIDDENANEK